MTDAAGTAEPTVEQELLGGRYRLLERVGEGGMAHVYRAEDTTLGRIVAVKILRRVYEGTSSQERAQAETRLLAALSYHSLVTLFDAHIDPDGPSYLVMEYMPGRTLRDRIEGGPLAPREVATLAVDLAEALHVVHSAGIVHRDVKPSNVLLCPSPVPGRQYLAKISDFGIAYLIGATGAGAPVPVQGTAAYLAPEQVKGASPTPAIDVYGLGLVLLEALTGARAFAPAEGVEELVLRLAHAPGIPESLPEGWRQLLTGMTAREPADRPTALEVARTAKRLGERREITEHIARVSALDTQPMPVAAALPAAHGRLRGRHVGRRRVAMVGSAWASVAVGARELFSIGVRSPGPRRAGRALPVPAARGALG